MNIIKATVNRDQTMRTGLGVLAWSGNLATYRAAGLMIDGRVYLAAVGLQAGDVVTNVMLEVTTGGTGTSLSKVGLYDSAASPSRLGISADQGTSWNSSGVKVIALTSAVTISATGIYYLAAIAKTATTMPTVAVGVSVDPLAVGSFPPIAGTMSTQTDLPTTVTLAQANNLNPWLACS